MQTLLEARDAGKILDLTPGGVRELVKRRQLEPIALTPRGLRLYLPEDVEIVRQRREARQERREQ